MVIIAQASFAQMHRVPPKAALAAAILRSRDPDVRISAPCKRSQLYPRERDLGIAAAKHKRLTIMCSCCCVQHRGKRLTVCERPTRTEVQIRECVVLSMLVSDRCRRC